MPAVRTIPSSAAKWHRSVFPQICGRVAWQAKRGFGTFITMEFGLPSLSVREARSIQELDRRRKTRSARVLSRRKVTVSGGWHLWVQYASWKIVRKGSVIASSRMGEAQMDKGIALLDSQKLLAARFDGDRNCLSLRFEHGEELQLVQYKGVRQGALLALYGPRDFYREVRPGPSADTFVPTIVESPAL